MREGRALTSTARHWLVGNALTPSKWSKALRCVIGIDWICLTCVCQHGTVLTVTGTQLTAAPCINSGWGTGTTMSHCSTANLQENALLVKQLWMARCHAAGAKQVLASVIRWVKGSLWNKGNEPVDVIWFSCLLQGALFCLYHHAASKMQPSLKHLIMYFTS